MRAVPVLVFTVAMAGSAQVFLDPGAALSLEQSVRDRNEPLVGCEISPIHPALTYSLHFESGYLANVPLGQFPGRGHQLAVLLRVTPKLDSSRAVHLIRRYELPQIPQTIARVELQGGFLTGYGVYDVSALVFDERGRACTSDWQIHVKPARRQRRLRPAMPGNTVASALRGDPVGGSARRTAVAERLTIFMHVALWQPDEGKLQPPEIYMLTDTLAALLERVPATHVRLVIFNLDQEREFLRRDEFRKDGLEQVAHTLEGVQLATVDIHNLQNRHQIDYLVGVINRELARNPSPDAMIFFGPPGWTGDWLTPNLTRTDPKGSHPIFYLQFPIGQPQSWMTSSIAQPSRPSQDPAIGSDAAILNQQPVPSPRTQNTDERNARFARRSKPSTADTTEFNAIRSTIKKLNGTTLVLWRPDEFAEAIRKMNRRLAKMPKR